LSYRWVDHTAEVELHIDAATPELVFKDALGAFAELVGAVSGPSDTIIVQLEAPDRGALLVQWIEELIFEAETEGFVPEAAHILHLSAKAVSAELIGRRGNPRPLVKAVTYHGLEFEPAGEGWRAKVVLDV
jgi:SHS2 domain-containing protein